MLKQCFRLKKRQDFRRVYQRGGSLKNRAFVLCFRAVGRKEYGKGQKTKQNTERLRIGFSVSKKIGKAVERNLVRRRLREACRLELACFPRGYDYVLIARGGAKNESVAGLRQLLKKLLANEQAFVKAGKPGPRQNLQYTSDKKA